MTLGGCTHSEHVRQRYIWPPPPNQPKLEFSGKYSSQHDLPCKSVGLLELLSGREDSVALVNPLGVAVSDDGRVYITDPQQSSVLVFDMKKCTVRALGDPGILASPIGVAVDGLGNVYVTDVTKKKVYIFDKDGNVLSRFGDKLKWPTGIAVDKERNLIYVVDRDRHCVDMFDEKGAYIRSIGERGSAAGKFKYPYGAAVNSKGELIVADSLNARIQLFSPEGVFLRAFGQRGNRPMDFDVIKGVAVNSYGHIYVTDAKAHKLMIFSENGEPLLDFYGRFKTLEGAEPFTSVEFTMPTGIAIDKNNTIFLVDTWNKRFQTYQYLDGLHSIKGVTK